MKKVSYILCTFLLLPLSACNGSQKNYDNTPISKLDLSRFLGKWYEIARYDHKFERDMQNVTAEYSLKENGMVKVLNAGTKNGERKIAEGKAKQPDPDRNPAHLRVSFFWFFYSDYNILMLADDYSYALVGSKSDKYLWILSREPRLDGNTKSAILSEARRRGYDTDALIWISHEESRDERNVAR